MDKKLQTKERKASGDGDRETGPAAEDSTSPKASNSSGSDDSSDLECAAFPEGASGDISIQSALEKIDLNVRQTLGLVLPQKNAGGHLESEGHKLREDISTLLSSESRAQRGSTRGGDWHAVSKISSRAREWMCDVEALGTREPLSPAAGI